MFRRITVIAAAVATSATVGATAVPANAISRDYETIGDAPVLETRVLDTQNETPPTDENGKKSCPIAKLDGGVQYFPHGTVITVKTPDGKSASAKCDDGDWKESASVLQTRVPRYSADLVQLEP